ncbi:MAG: DegV family protein [Anaerolineae bacterium]
MNSSAKHPVRIIADTTAVLDPAYVAAHKLEVIPQVIMLEGQSYLEDVELSYDEFIRRLKTSPQLPKTAAPRPGDYVEAFRRQLAEAETLICVVPSADVSGTLRSALTAKEQAFPDADIRVFDTRTIGAGLGSLVRASVAWAELGMNGDEIVARLKDMAPRNRTYFLIRTLEYLQKGGRIGGASALVGSLLQIKPILQINDGRVDVLEKVRSQHRAVERLIELVAEQCPRSSEGYLSVMHADVPQDATRLAEQLKAVTGIGDIPIYTVGSAITTHGGPGVLGVSFFVAP